RLHCRVAGVRGRDLRRAWRGAGSCRGVGGIYRHRAPRGDHATHPRNRRDRAAARLGLRSRVSRADGAGDGILPRVRGGVLLRPAAHAVREVSHFDAERRAVSRGLGRRAATEKPMAECSTWNTWRRKLMRPQMQIRALIVLGGLVLILAIVNWQIVAKERVLRNGELLLLELAPVDP